MKDEITRLVEHYYQVAESKLNRTFNRPTVRFDLRGTVGGKANYFGGNYLRFNLDLAIRNPEEYKNVTVPHEIAHLIADSIQGKRCIHGPYWKYIMRHVFGLEPLRCHNMDTSEVKARRTISFNYGCNCGKTFEIGKNRHWKIQTLGKKFHCKRCKGLIYFIGDKENQTSLISFG